MTDSQQNILPTSISSAGSAVMEAERVEERLENLQLNPRTDAGEIETINESFSQSSTKFKFTTVGPKGAEIDIYGFRLTFPKNAVKEETQFEFSVDNDPQHYPKKNMPITAILCINPSVNFERPVSVKMRTWYSAMRGKAMAAQIMCQEEEDSDWELEKEVVLTDRNEINFDVWRFSGLIATARRDSRVIGQGHLINSVFLHISTGVVTSVFCKEKKALSELESYFTEHGSVLAPPTEISAEVNSLLQVEVKCAQPEDVIYCCEGVPARPGLIKVYEALVKESVSCYFRPINFPLQYEGPFVADYFVRMPDSESGDFCAVLSTFLPI